MIPLPKAPEPLSPMGLMAMKRKEISARTPDVTSDYPDFSIPSMSLVRPSEASQPGQPMTARNPQNQAVINQIPSFQGYQPGNVVITQRFGNPNARLYGRSKSGAANINRGLDVAKKPGEPQFAPPEGEWIVESAYTGNGFNTGWGRSVVIKNTKTGERIRRSHLDKVYAKPGQVVTGKPLGTTGRTGRTTGYHADIEYMTPKGKLSDYSRSKYFRYEGKI